MVILSTGSIWPYGLNRTFAIAQKSGFAGVELMLRGKQSDSWWDTWDVSYLQNLQDNYSIRITSLHAPFSIKNKPQIFPDVLDLGGKLAVDNITVHIPRKDHYQYANWFNNKYRTQAGQYPVTVSAENIPLHDKKADPAIDSVEELSQLPSLTFDVAHSLRSGQKPLAMLPRLDNVKELHISHWDGKKDHMSILQNKEYYKNLLLQNEADITCLELCPKAFPSIKNEEKIVAILNKTRRFLENI